MTRPLRVHCSVVSADPDVIVRATEAFARAVTGLALEGVEAFMSIMPDDEEPAP